MKRLLSFLVLLLGVVSVLFVSTSPAKGNASFGSGDDTGIVLVMQTNAIVDYEAVINFQSTVYVERLYGMYSRSESQEALSLAFTGHDYYLCRKTCESMPPVLSCPGSGIRSL